jgi:MOSC domain-containing protein YiiM
LSDSEVGVILAIAIRTCENGPMKEIRQAAVTVGGGIGGDLPSTPERGVTLIASRQWDQVTRSLEADLPWHTRRANVLVDAESLAGVIGKTVRVGDALIRIHAETKPCDLMDRLHAGLKNALAPDCRGGVRGEVLNAGTFQVGQAISLEQSSD